MAALNPTLAAHSFIILIVLLNSTLYLITLCGEDCRGVCDSDSKLKYFLEQFEDIRRPSDARMQ